MPQEGVALGVICAHGESVLGLAILVSHQRLATLSAKHGFLFVVKLQAGKLFFPALVEISLAFLVRVGGFPGGILPRRHHNSRPSWGSLALQRMK